MLRLTREMKWAFGLLAALLLTVNSVFVFATGGGEKPKGQETFFAISVRAIDNEYHANWDKGAKLFTTFIGMQQNYSALLCQNNNQLQIDQIKALIEKSNGRAVFVIDPQEGPVLRPIAEICEKNKIYWVSHWDKPPDMHPWDYKYWVSHISADGTVGGYEIAKKMFAAFPTPNKGKIVALQGALVSQAAIDRFQGLQRALKEFPGVQLLDQQTAEWDRTKAVQTVENWLVAYPSQIDGVWAANDSMALGAVEALRSAGLAGKVKVVGCDGDSEAVEAIIKGEMTADVTPDPMWQAGMGLSLAYHALTGTFDPTQLPKEKREWYVKWTMLDSTNAQKYLDGLKTSPVYDWNDLWGRWAGPLQYR